jgi:hypothetical protein
MAPARIGRAQDMSGDDRLWVFFDANGAWDPTLFCDPHAHPDFVSSSIYSDDDIMTNGRGVRYAPKSSGERYMVNGADFFQKYADQLLVINGFDSRTNNHTVGSRYVWSGKKGDTHPCLGALIAAAHLDVAPGAVPLAFLSTGGFDRTLKLVPITRVASTDPLLKLTQPNLRREDRPGEVYHHPEVMEMIKARQRQRTARLVEEQGLPQIRAALAKLQSGRATEDALAAILDPLNTIPSVGDNANPLLAPARTAMAAMAAGICKCANLSLRGFDTHSNHDDPVAGHRPRLQEIFDAIDYVMEVAGTLGFADRLVVVIGSDFGRTRYNRPVLQDGDAPAGAGKDHWPITSMMFLGADIPGGVIGETRVVEGLSGVQAQRVTVSGGRIIPTTEDIAGETTVIEAVHAHHALRCLAGIRDHPLAVRYPVHLGGDFPLPILPDVPGWQAFSSG